ncbi:transglutaminase family protein [Humisphaera borealis]|uniref:Transglutaminase family protein n=1 Tax=Humisphaera borealis TaxID=2807512 RepID=A0A7M2X170_9BACT|nr:transglutaminase family protein [Humisphaera borealis]QOV91425.1 transglutaminase family protein [Humisphaera borealis]
MAIRVALTHRTRYRYPKPVWLSPHVVRLRPAPHCRTPILSYSLKVTPSDHFVNWQQDPYSNRLARLVFPKKTKEFAIEVDLVAELTVINPFDFFVDKYAEEFPFTYDETLQKELAPYLAAAPLTPKLTTFVEEARKCAAKEDGKNPRTIDFLVALNSKIQHAVKYLIRLEPGVQTPEETLEKACGSCRDSAWLMVQVLRNVGLAARFVSGYLIQLTPDVKSLDGPSGTAVDFTDLHAWTEVYLPGAGWIGFDATSGLLAGEGHIPLACTADPVTAAAITGFFSTDDQEVTEADPDDHALHGGGGDDGDFEFHMSVTRIHEDPRVTKPYTDEQWAAIEALGHQVDADLKKADVRLTMGGEPTFVSIDDMDGPEWNTTALGPMKYQRANELLRRLRDKFAPNGLLHHGQGKWYPGESLPRWSMGIYWRKDGEPIWKNKALFADEHNKTRVYTDEDARAFMHALVERLDISPRFINPGFEDVWYYLWKERRLPVNVDPFDSKLENKEDRQRLAKIFEQGLDKVVGYALPLRRDYYTDGTGAWVSGDWFFRPERMYLIPGDSPMGYRLPLDSIPWVVKSDYPFVHELDPWAERSPLPSRDAFSRQRYLTTSVREGTNPLGFQEQVLGPAETFDVGPEFRIGSGVGGSAGNGGIGRGPGTGSGTGPGSAANRGEPRFRRPARSETPPLQPVEGESAPWIVRTALCTEVRGGVLRVFMPPQRFLEDYLELVTAVEDTAEALQMPVLLEGYTPPYDIRLAHIKVTPDPGVIEVNTQPTETWDDLVKNTEILYEEARLSRLGTEKFMLDGRHTGTGGGNHIVVGSSIPSDSPFLRRPDLLKSLIGYWHNHPSLSFLFSGMFVGPTSQAPRVDEARNDQVYELEIAFKQVPDHGTIPPWLVDRIFRNLLIDSTGNTHRAEFCIDKLYSPDSATGRLGLLEMRAFEMPPHARMSLTQHLLLRALISKFWKQPYTHRLVRWKTEIHDRFLLPHFVKQDMEDVIDDLNEAGYPLQDEWFAPHMEFRFPHYGSIEQRGIVLDIRQAIEPWNVLGEEGAAGGTVRFVDSSVERLEVKVTGMVDSRHTIAVNGVRVPLHPTGQNGQFVAGVRYRAWQPPSCLHPTIGVHSPLIFDVIDNWAGRSIGGCTYNVSHPGGRSYDRFPVNAYEAESRRISRFFKFGHTPGKIRVIEPTVSKEFPFTLDLRRV